MIRYRPSKSDAIGSCAQGWGSARSPWRMSCTEIELLPTKGYQVPAFSIPRTTDRRPSGSFIFLWPGGLRNSKPSTTNRCSTRSKANRCPTRSEQAKDSPGCQAIKRHSLWQVRSLRSNSTAKAGLGSANFCPRRPSMSTTWRSYAR